MRKQQKASRLLGELTSLYRESIHQLWSLYDEKDFDQVIKRIEKVLKPSQKNVKEGRSERI